MALQALTLRPDGSQSSTPLTIATTLSSKGATADVCTFVDAPPTIVGKLYRPSYRQRFATHVRLLEGLVLFTRNSEALRKDLPFGSWPGQLLLDAPITDSESLKAVVCGFTMDRLTATTPLMDLLGVRRARVRLTTHDSLNIAITISTQLDKLHRHPWQFVFGDFSPNNIMLSANFERVMFIDTDAYQYKTTYRGRIYEGQNDATTPSYNSPHSVGRKGASKLPPEHDLFILAIIIFQILMADKGFLKCHPFSSGSVPEDDRIKARQFPYAEPNRYPVNPAALKAYHQLPKAIRDAFVEVFSKHFALTTGAWITLLSNYRRDLHRR